MSPRLRKLALTAHVAVSVGWLGAVAAVLALAIAAVTSADTAIVRAAYLAMDVSAGYALVPLSLASLATGVVMGLGTRWGLLTHYWVIFKLVLNVLASVVLLAFTSTLATLASVAAQPEWTTAALAQLRGPGVVIHAVGALAVLLAATVLSVYKPRGTTAWGRPAVA